MLKQAETLSCQKKTAAPTLAAVLASVSALALVSAAVSALAAVSASAAVSVSAAVLLPALMLLPAEESVLLYWQFFPRLSDCPPATEAPAQYSRFPVFPVFCPLPAQYLFP